mgnify:FL=1
MNIVNKLRGDKLVKSYIYNMDEPLENEEDFN